MAPDVAPPQEEEHGDLGDEEAAQEGLSAHYRHEKEGQHRRCQTVLEPTQLVLGNPELTFLKVGLGRGRDASFVDQEVNELIMNQSNPDLD